MKNSCGKVFHFYFADQQKNKEENNKIKQTCRKMGKHGNIY